MKKVDLMFAEETMETLRTCIGCVLFNYSYDNLDMVNRVNRLLVQIENAFIELNNEFEVIDIDGDEDFAVLKLHKKPESEMNTDTEHLVHTFVNLVVEDIQIIRDLIVCKEFDNELYRVEIDQGLIFNVGGQKVAFEKDVWFSESMILHHALKNDSDLLPVGDGWIFEYPLKSQLTRTFVSLRE
jgi:hypothetical protein